MQNFKPLASLWSWAGQFESNLVGNHEDRFSRDEAQMFWHPLIVTIVNSVENWCVSILSYNLITAHVNTTRLLRFWRFYIQIQITHFLCEERQIFTLGETGVSLVFTDRIFLGVKIITVFVCLFVLRLNVPVNNFSVMSGGSHRFLGN